MEKPTGEKTKFLSHSATVKEQKKKLTKTWQGKDKDTKGGLSFFCSKVLVKFDSVYNNSLIMLFE